MAIRKLITREDKDKKTRRNAILIGGILILLMIVSTVGYSFMSGGTNTNSKRIVFNNIQFDQDPASGYWIANINSNQFVTTYNPEETKDIPVLVYSTLSDYSGKPLYFAGTQNEGFSELARNLADRFVLRINFACITGQNCTGDYPIKNCSTDNLIIIENSNNKTQRVYQEENCIYIIANESEQSRYSDATLFKIMGL